MVTAIAHAHATGRLDSSSLDKTPQANLELNSKQNWFRRVLDAILIRHTRYASSCIIYLRGIISNQTVDIFFPFSSKPFSFFFFSFVSPVSYFMYYYTSHHHPIPYYIAIVAPYRPQTRTDIDTYMHISRGTLSIRPSVISFFIFTRIYNIHPIHLYHHNTQRFSHTSLVYCAIFIFCFLFFVSDLK
jgi:hypothetical protein